MVSFDEYQSAHLFVLVGTNPLPNYVAIYLLRPERGHIYLVHTAETRVIADRLCTVIGLKPGHDATKVLVNDMSASEIIKNVRQYADGKSDLGLHYTGGTKRMVLYTQQAIIQAAARYNLLPTFSYLDARSLALYIEKKGGNTRILPTLLRVQPSLKELLALHGYSASGDRSTPIGANQPDLYTMLMQTPYKAFLDWWKSAKEGMGGRMEQVLLPQNDDLAPLSAHWQGIATLGELAKSWQTDISRLTGWFDNMGLEDYTLWALQQTVAQTGVHATAMNIKPAEISFEFDVIALRGYQLFAISCANADNKEKLKLKLFEAFVRARQMGGDEARVAVVCRAPRHDRQRTPAIIEQEIRNEWDNEGKIRVFGEEHLPDLSTHLAQWLTKQP